MRELLAIGMLGLVGCAQHSVVIEEFEDCKVTQIIRDEKSRTFSIETYECTGEEIKEKGIFDI